MTFYYVRHGEPIYRPDSLTKKGELQAKALSEKLGQIKIDRIFASTSIRAIQTAKPTADICADSLKDEIKTLDFCYEEYASDEFSIFENGVKIGWCFDIPADIARFNSREILSLGKEWYDASEFFDKRYKEGLLRIGMGADALLSELGYDHDIENGRYIARAPSNENVALFAHKGFGLVFLSWILDIPYNIFSTRFDIGHSSVTVVEFNDVDGVCYPKVKTLSNDAHLYKNGLTMEY